MFWEVQDQTSNEFLYDKRLIERHLRQGLLSEAEVNKRLEGLDRFARSKSKADEGIYAPRTTKATYQRIAELAGTIVAGGYPAIADATHLTRDQRALIRNAAHRAGVPCIVINCHAPKHVLEVRVADRALEGHDVSEADVEILRRQLETLEPVEPKECDVIIDVDTSRDIDLDALVARIVEIRQPS